MCTGVEIAAIVAAAASVASTAYAASQGTPDFPEPAAPPAPPGPVPDLSPDQLAGKRSQIKSGEVPLQLGGGLTTKQQRSSIASRALYGSGSFKGQEFADYFRGLAHQALQSETGQLADYSEILPVEKQYVEQVLGQQIRNPTTAAFLSALYR